MSSKAEHEVLSSVLRRPVSRREFLGWSAATLGALALPAGCGSDSSTNGPNTKSNPNILFILTDNQPTWMIGCYGSQTVKTPNIDRLAAEGMRFTRTFACNGLCSPTRASLMTGLLPSQHGIHDWISDSALDSQGWPKDWCAVQEFRTLPLTLANRGYQTAMIGKYHMGQPRSPMPRFQYWVTFPYGHTLDFWQNTIFDNGQEFDLKDRHIVEYFAERGVEYLNIYSGNKPFYLQLNFDGPYLLPPTNLGLDRNRFYNDYVGSDFADWPSVNLGTLNPIFETYIETACPIPPDPSCPVLTSSDKFNCGLFKQIQQMAGCQQRESRANTASQNAVVDLAVGMVLDALKKNGLDENTLVIFSSDQADYYGQHGMFGHTNFTVPARLYDSLLNVPFILRRPGTIPANQVSDLLIGQYDIMPTILDLAGFGNVPIDNTPGRSFAPFLRGQRLNDWHEEVYFEQEETRGIRTANWAYWKSRPMNDGCKWPPDSTLPGTRHLFDVANDPGQYVDLAGNSEYMEIERELDAKLRAFFCRFADPQFDLWCNGKTKSYTERTDELNKEGCVQWELDKTIRPPFVDRL